MTDMTRIRCCLIALGAACLTAPGLVLAIEPGETLREVRGTVLVNDGRQYDAGYSGMRLQPNARVMVMARSSAAVKGRSGVTELGPYSVFTSGQSTVQQFAYTQASKRGRASRKGEAVARSEEARRHEAEDEDRRHRRHRDHEAEEEEEEEDDRQCPKRRHGERCPISPDR